MELLDLFTQLGIALGLGLLVGFEREKTSAEIAGVRTVPLITISGTIAAWLSQTFGGWVLAASILAIAAFVVLANVYLIRKGALDEGLTNEFAILVMFGVGALVVVAPHEIAIAIGGGVAVLLHAKEPLHRWTAQVERSDVRAIMRFALIALVILPILPNRDFGPFGVLNPREIWWMVVLIVGISLGGFIIARFAGPHAGVLAGGVLGGIISSTATTFSYARRTHGDAPARLAAVVVMIANAVLMIRVLIEISLVGRRLLPYAFWPVTVMLVVQTALAGALWWSVRAESAEIPRQKDPAELRPALVFAALYAVVLVAVAAARQYLGREWLYVVSLISGLTDVDAITLSTARLADAGALDMSTAWRLIIVATMANLVFKSAVVAVVAARRMAVLVGTLSAVSVAAGAVLLAVWPS
ncbi:MAG: MgtC/SapB family protein [Thermoanaerobaculia bacterium]